MAQQDPPIRGIQWSLPPFPIYNSAGNAQTGAGISSASVSKDFGAYVGTANAVNEITGSGMYAITLTAAEMTADVISLKIVTAAYGTYAFNIMPRVDLAQPVQVRQVAFGTNQSILIRLARKDGSTLDGLVYNTAGLACEVLSEDGMVNGSIPLVALGAFNVAWASGGFIQVDSSAAPGLYRLDIPNAWLTNPLYKRVNLILHGAVGMAPTNVLLEVGAYAFLDEANGIETGLTLRQAIRIAMAALAGKVTGAATTTVTIRNVGDTKNRIVATVDPDGNRTAVTTDGT